MHVEHTFRNHFIRFDLFHQIQLSVLLTVSFLSSIYFIGTKIPFIVFIALLPLIFLSLYNFKLLLLILPVLLFVNINASVFSISELFVPLITLSFLMTYEDIRREDFDIPLKRYLFFYLVVLVISMVKSLHPLLSLLGINHYILFLILIFILYSTLKSTDIIIRIINIYLFVLALNTIHVIIQAVTTGKRVFGFAGIMYVDYVGIGIVISIILTVFAKRRRKRILFGLLVLVYTIGLILTQTRTSWISTGTAVLLVFIFMATKLDYFNVNRKSFRRFSIAIAVILSLGIVSAIVFNPKTFNRVSDVEKTSVSETGEVSNSFVSRAFIWHTAYNGFIQNPVLGIGAYAFPFSSQNYYSINKILYKIYVQGLSPHQTFVAVAVETGIIGFFVFIMLYVMLLRYVKRKILQFTNQFDRELALMLGGGILYCLVSMFTTDAWLWGHGIVLLGLFIGMFFAHERIAIRPELV